MEMDRIICDERGKIIDGIKLSQCSQKVELKKILKGGVIGDQMSNLLENFLKMKILNFIFKSR